MSKISKLIEICRFEEDNSAWKDIFLGLFNGLEYGTLCLWHNNRNKIVRRLIEKKKKSVENYDSCEFEPLKKYFKRGTDGRLITKVPLYINENMRDEISNTTIAKKPIFLGEGVTLLDSSIRTSAYLGDGAKLINTRIVSTKDREGETNYIGESATIEDAHQFCKSVVGSGIKDFNKYEFSYIHTAINGAIIGGSTAISNSVGWQSHWTRAEDTKLIDIENPRNAINLSHKRKSSTPTIIGCNCRIGNGVHITSPLIVEANQIIGERKDDRGRALSGAYLKGLHYYIESNKNGKSEYMVRVN